MLELKKRYVTDENNQPIAVQIDLVTFEKLERIVEDHGLAKLIQENDPEEGLSLEDAKLYYSKLSKAQ